MPSFLPHQQHHYKDHHRCCDEHHGDDDEKVSVIAASTYGGFLLDLDQFPEWANATQCPEKWRHCKKCQTVKIMILNNAQSILNRQDSTVELRIKCMNIEEAIFVFLFFWNLAAVELCIFLFVCLSVFLAFFFWSLFLLKSWCCRVVYRLRPSFFPWEAAAASPFRRGETPNNELVANNQKAKWENKHFHQTGLLITGTSWACDCVSFVKWRFWNFQWYILEHSLWSWHNSWQR